MFTQTLSSFLQNKDRNSIWFKCIGNLHIDISPWMIWKIAVLITYFTPLNAQQKWLWAKETTGRASGQHLIEDREGNVICVGDFSESSISFGGHKSWNHDTAGVKSDIFVAKFTAGGEVLWSKGLGSKRWDYIRDGTVDDYGNVYVLAKIDGPDFAFAGKKHTISATSVIFKFDKDGTEKNAWLIDSAWCEGRSLAADDRGLIVTGSFRAAKIFDGEYQISNNNVKRTFTYRPHDLFLARYNFDGVLQWANSVSGEDNEKGVELSIAPGGDIVVTGSSDSPVVTIDSDTLAFDKGKNQFLARFSPNGKLKWCKAIQKNISEYRIHLTVDKEGNIISSGDTETIYHKKDGKVVYMEDIVSISKFDERGGLLWKRDVSSMGIGGNSFSMSDMITDMNGDLYCSGIFGSDSLKVGDILIKRGLIGSVINDPRGLLLKIGKAGQVYYATVVGDKGYVYSLGITGGRFDEFYITGKFDKDMSIGQFHLNSGALGAAYIAKFSGNNSMTSEEPWVDIIPNPSTDYVFLHFKTDDNVVEAFVRDANGTLVQTIRSEGKHYLLKVSSLSSGPYFIQPVNSKQRGQSGKLFVK